MHLLQSCEAGEYLGAGIDCYPNSFNKLVDRCETAILSQYEYLAFSNLAKNKNRFYNYGGDEESMKALKVKSM